DIAGIEGFDEDVGNELRTRAREYIAVQTEKLTAQRKELGVTDEVAGAEGMTPAMLVPLGEKDVKTLDDLADLASDELRDIVGRTVLTTADADAIIMAARAHWFEGEEGAEAAPAAEAEAEAPAEAETPAEPTEPEPTEPEKT
ncbi:MAG: hypothetical protein COA65_09215, partial [Rhodospirillaceae bacterium]